MKEILKKFVVFIGILVCLLILGLVKKSFVKIAEEAKKPNLVDDFIGKTSLDRYEQIKDRADHLEFNLPSIKTSIMMFYAEKGRYPSSMEELENSGDGNSGITRDKHGKMLDLKILEDHKALITAPGPDRIMGTTDDIKRELQL